MSLFTAKVGYFGLRPHDKNPGILLPEVTLIKGNAEITQRDLHNN